MKCAEVKHLHATGIIAKNSNSDPESFPAYYTMPPLIIGYHMYEPSKINYFMFHKHFKAHFKALGIT